MILDKKNTTFVLGARDPEMEAIENVLRGNGWRVSYMKDSSGMRVLPHTAYKGILPDDAVGKLVYVECYSDQHMPVAVADHHREGDPGFSLPSEKFWEASSLGQVSRLIGADDLKHDTDLRIIAAADHCLASAYAGECPDVDPNDVIDFRARQKAEFLTKQGRPTTKDDIIEDMRLSLAKIASLPKTVIPGYGKVRDAREEVIDYLNEVAAISGETVMYRLPETRKTKEKEGIFSRDPRAVRAWMTWAEKRRFSSIWGDPVRGFAGGFPS